MDNVIAVHTYGSQRIKHPQTHKTISAYKLSYTSAASAVLLALYRDKARDVSSKHASYYYIQIDGETSVRHGFLLLKVSDEELTRAEAATRKYHRAATYVWRNGKWFELPSSQNQMYSEATLRSGCPTFDPSGFRAVSPTTGEKEAVVESIQVEKSQRDPNQKAWFWINGETYPYRELLKRWGCRWSQKRKAWYFTGWDLPEAIQRLIDEHNTGIQYKHPTKDMPDTANEPCSVEEAAAILGVRIKDKIPLNTDIHSSDAPSVTNPSQNTELTLDETEEPPKIRIIKPVLQMSDPDQPNVVATAIRQTKSTGIPVVHRSNPAHSKRTLNCISQHPCGELTGSITGNVWCYGFAIHEGICIYLNMGGPKMAVEAIRARLAKGDVVNCIPWDAPSVELTAGEGNTGMYSAFMQNIPEAKFTSLILCHELLTQPNYGGKSMTFLIYVSDEQAMAQLRDHITKLVKVPVFPEWTGYLWQAGQSAMLIRKIRGAGGVDVLAVELDIDSWTRLLTGGLANKVIELPQTHVE